MHKAPNASGSSQKCTSCFEPTGWNWPDHSLTRPAEESTAAVCSALFMTELVYVCEYICALAETTTVVCSRRHVMAELNLGVQNHTRTTKNIMDGWLVP